MEKKLKFTFIIIISTLWVCEVWSRSSPSTIMSMGLLKMVSGQLFGSYNPQKLSREQWAYQRMATNLLNLTQTICKDAMYKLRMADLIQEQYKYTLPYELGLLASSIMDNFKHMLKIYRYYSREFEFRNKNFDTDKLLNAYHIIQGDYNLIRAERDLYYDVIDRHERKRKWESRQSGKHKLSKKIKRRSMDTEIIQDTFLPRFEENKKVNDTEWRINTNDVEEEEYKKKLRYLKWADQWKGFNPEVEGIHIPQKFAAIGLANASNFHVKELKGVV